MSSPLPVERERIRTLNKKETNQHGTFVLYWMNNSVRERHNPALEEAASVAVDLKQPLRVVYLLDVIAQDGKPLPERHAYFLLQGLIDVAAALRRRHIPFIVAAPGLDATVAIRTFAEGASAVFTDASYLRPGIEVRTRTAKALNIPLAVVEGDVVVPVETASNKAEHAARTFRPRITRLLDDYIRRLKTVALPFQEQSDGVWDIEGDWLTAAREKDENIQAVDVNHPDAVLASWHGLDRGSPRVTAFMGGQNEAQRILDCFLNDKFLEYGKGRNEPAKQLQSDLSPYLRAGNISPVDIALQTKVFAKGKAAIIQESASSFLEELIVRRELAVNACWFNPARYDLYNDMVPTFAKASLTVHRTDKRPKIYTYEELEAGVTNDAYWNAAQLEMVVRGKQHGYMRMYWAKQIIGWVEDPAVAMDYALRLNNRWELDAVDPNSYTGVLWCFGLHDRGWKERPIWGKVRYMNDSGLKRKFNMTAYVSMVERMVSKEGLPAHIAELRKTYGFGEHQITSEQAMKRSRSASAQSSRNRAGKQSLLWSVKRLKA